MTHRATMTASPSPLDDRIAAVADELLGFFRRRAPADAEELSQEVWLRVASAKAPADPSGFRAYTYTVARRLLIDRYRRARHRGPLVSLDGGLSDSSDPHADAIASQTLEVVERCLAGMKPEVAQVFRWRLTSDLPFKDIAAQQGCSLNTALGRQHQATKSIARALRDAGLGRPE